MMERFTDDAYHCNAECPDGHAWVAGMAYVNVEDAAQVARERAGTIGRVECETCEIVLHVGA